MKTVDRNLLLLGIPALLSLFAGIALFAAGNALLNAAAEIMPDAPGGSAGDVEGYAFLIRFFGSGLGQLTGIIVLVFGMLLMLYGGVMAVLNIAARALYRPTPGRILAYRIVVGADLAVLVLPVPSLLSSFVQSAMNGSFSPGMLAIPLVLLCLGALAARNTYTRRITEPPLRAGERNVP